MKIIIITILTTLLRLGYSSPELKTCPHQFDTLAGMNVFTQIDHMPEFPGGESALMRFLVRNFRNSEQDQFQATFFCRFVIDRTGKVIAVGILNKSPSEWSPAERALVNAVNKMPKWKPGSCAGKLVPLLFVLPLRL
ncbi:hypothetical protein FHW36_103504 [Chitinophaga polysaccharea]|uniref:TonB-like protein n=1 Tax=Chitinophaga polysaccharea TaxID=1293035 RepID=A0A561PUC1_9BACT|nr:hypothetical protein [Chitinophaga polysaccharea]TWF41700.1 hypothetical protein FHW36_103504 [Chitinophaga polysaccharea]